MLRQYKRVIGDSVEKIEVLDALKATDAQVTFGVNTFGTEAFDFYLTVLSDDSVLYSDGVDENEIPVHRS